MWKKTSLAGALFLAGFLCALWLTAPSKIPPAWAGEKACIAGDINGDEAANIADAVYLLNHLFKGGPPPVACTAPLPDRYFLNNLEAATIVVVRHAEKESAGEDPGLNSQGVERAAHLAEVLKHAPVTHLIASEFRRTQETLQPIATDTGLPIEEIADEDIVAARLKSLDNGSFAVVAGHSFTIHNILEGLGFDSSIRNISVSGTNYDNVFMVVRTPHRSPQLVHMKY